MKKAVKQSRREMKKRIKQLEAQLSPFGGPRLPPVIVERPEVVTLRAERTFSKAFERWRPPKEIVLQDLVQNLGSAVWKNGLFTATETQRPDCVKYVVECRVLRPANGQEYGNTRVSALFGESLLRGLSAYDKEPIGIINDDELKGLRTHVVFTEDAQPSSCSQTFIPLPHTAFAEDVRDRIIAELDEKEEAEEEA